MAFISLDGRSLTEMHTYVHYQSAVSCRGPLSNLYTATTRIYASKKTPTNYRSRCLGECVLRKRDTKFACDQIFGFYMKA